MNYTRVYINGNYYNRINKIKAKRVFTEGVELILYPVNMNPNSSWAGITRIKKDTNRYNFYQVINEFMFFNCNPELGLYPKYYILEK